MTRALVWRPAAQADLLDLYDWIAAHAGGDVAYAYTSALEAFAAKLIDTPFWGPAREDLGPGLRIVTYRRRTRLAYRVRGEAVEIVRLAHAGRDLGRAFGGDDD